MLVSLYNLNALTCDHEPTDQFPIEHEVDLHIDTDPFLLHNYPHIPHYVIAIPVKDPPRIPQPFIMRLGRILWIIPSSFPARRPIIGRTVPMADAAVEITL
jgi:hypothetical protein